MSAPHACLVSEDEFVRVPVAALNAADRRRPHLTTELHTGKVNAVKTTLRAAIVLVVLGCVVGAVWVFVSPAASTAVIGNANVVGGLGAVVALLVAVLVLWPRATRPPAAGGKGFAGAGCG